MEKMNLKNNERDWLCKNNIQLYFVKNLHAKCYLNEDTSIITSMNLFDFSQVNNIDLGVLFSKRSESLESGMYKNSFNFAEELLPEIIRPFKRSNASLKDLFENGEL